MMTTRNARIVVISERWMAVRTSGLAENHEASDGTFLQSSKHNRGLSMLMPTTTNIFMLSLGQVSIGFHFKASVMIISPVGTVRTRLQFLSLFSSQ